MRFTIFLVLLFVLQVPASSINDHAAMTYESIAQFEQCLGRKLSSFARENLVLSNVDEDMNLFRKWLSYSHFYNPYKNVATWRGTSMNRMIDSQNFVLEWKRNINANSSAIGVQSAISELGHLIHHVQDSTVPAHVVPVKHWLSDAYESYAPRVEAISLNCSELTNSLTPAEQLRESAIQTLNSLGESFQARFRGKMRTLNWEYFWYDNKEKFGSYGYFGNKFGSTSIATPSGVFDVPEETYRNFWLARRKQGVQRTAQLLHWFFANLITAHGHSRIQMSDGSEVSLEEFLFEK